MSTLRVLTAVGWVTFLEILRDKVLYNTLVMSVLLFGLGILVSKTSFIRPDRVVLDFGLTAIALSNGMLGVLLGSSMLAREFDRRTIHIALTRPITRLQFLFGKFSGLALVLLLNGALLSLGHLLVLKLLSGETSLISLTLLQALALLAVQSVFLAAIAVFFSTFSTPSISTMLTMGLYLIGVNVSQVAMLAVKQEPGVAKILLEVLSATLPNFEVFNLGSKVTYGLMVSGAFIVTALLYAATWVATLLGAGGLLLERKETR